MDRKTNEFIGIKIREPIKGKYKLEEKKELKCIKIEKLRGRNPCMRK